MPFTLVGYSESQDSAVLVNIAALADQHVRVVGDDIYVPALDQLCAYHFHGANFTLGQVSSPSLRVQTLIDVEPADLAAEPGSPASFHDLFTNPIPLVASEALNTLMGEDAAGASRVTALVWFSDGPITPVTGKIQTVRATGSTTLTANAWTNVALTFSQTLPAGTYQVVGMRAQSAGCEAARLVAPAYPWRPGVIGCDADGDIMPSRFRYGQAGVFVEFAHDAPPTVDFLSVSADTSEVVHLDLIKTA